MTPLISVVVTVYNSEKTIRNCLESICNQTYNNLEILVVYLAGEDNSLQAIRSFKDERIHLIEQIEKTGPGGARNLGIDKAKGEWIGFVEADDVIAPDFYEKLLSAAIKSKCDIAQGEIISNGKQWTFAQDNKILENLEEKYHFLQTEPHLTSYLNWISCTKTKFVLLRKFVGKTIHLFLRHFITVKL